MTRLPSYRPWGELEWVLSLCDTKSWHFIGCLGTEERSVASVLKLHRAGLLETSDLVRIRDTEPANPVAEEEVIAARLRSCEKESLTANVDELTLEAPLNKYTWSSGFDFSSKANVCIDISSLPKRFFFSAIKAALKSSEVRNLLVLYAVPESYPQTISSNPNPWASMDNFGLLDPDRQQEVDSHLIVSAGFVVDGLAAYLKNRTRAMSRSILIPFPAEEWSSVRRSWESARLLEESLTIPKDETGNKDPEIYHRASAQDASGAFDILLSLTRRGTQPAALAPLGPKPISLSFCLLASQSEIHPVYYAQPQTYPVDYSIGYKKTYAYWVKHEGENLYVLSPSD